MSGRITEDLPHVVILPSEEEDRIVGPFPNFNEADRWCLELEDVDPELADRTHIMLLYDPRVLTESLKEERNGN